MLPRLLLVCGFAFLLPASAWAQVDLGEELELVRAQNRWPGLMAMVGREGRIVAQGAAGVRKEGAATPLLISDAVNIGSCTKWMTATVAGRLVDRGLITWDRQVKQVFEAGKFSPALASATLEQLLAHRSGLEDGGSWEKKHGEALGHQAGSISRVRRWAAETALQDGPQVEPGTYLYSNQGYAVAAVMLEAAAGKSWETLMREELFQPLGMTTATLGCSYRAEAGAPTMVVGHDFPDGAERARPRGAPSELREQQYQGSNGAGGSVRCSLAMWLRFLHKHATGAAGYLQPATTAKLQTPFANGGDYGLGIAAHRAAWAAPGPALAHGGDIYGEDTLVWVAPARRMIVVLFTNVRLTKDEQWGALDAEATKLVKRFGE